jgi:prepilin-type N-terminal cleavage/methylation domain-containing protein
MLIGKIFQKGDTLIEVLFAVTVFSLVVVGALSIMNSSTAVAERALETTLVRNQIDAQAEALRYIHDSYIATYPNPVAGQPSAEWSTKITTNEATSASAFGTCTPPGNAFVVNTGTDKVESSSVITTDVQTYAQLRLNPTVSEGLWVEAIKSNNTNKYIDFHIRACWYSQGLNVPMTLGTIVRLYEP